jgi:Zn-dependent metalloprotease
MKYLKHIAIIIACLLITTTTARKTLHFDTILQINNLKTAQEYYYVVPDTQKKGSIKNYLVAPGAEEVIAKRFLQNNKERFGIKDVAEELRLRQILKSPAGKHVIFQEYVMGIPVYDSEIVVTLDNQQSVSYIAGNYRPNLKLDYTQPFISAGAALAAALAYLDVTGALLATPTSQLVVFESKNEGARLTYRVLILTTEPRGDWSIFVDAINGNIIHVQNRMLFSHQADGSGMVWNPDPLTTAQNYYGGLFQDEQDADSEELNAQRVVVTLKDITFDAGYYSLEGPYVKLVDIEAPLDSFPVLVDSTGFVFTRSQQEFEHVMVYYHIDKAYRWLSDLGFDIPGLYKFKADPHGVFDSTGVNGDVSYYSPSGNFCVFGEVGVDDAEDAAVIWHEYEHAIQENIPPSMNYYGETAAIQEGSSDYWAASHSRTISDFGWQQVFIWDAGNTSPADTLGTFWSGRRCNLDWKYPENYINAFQYRHKNGQIWSSALMHIWSELGREVTDKLFIQSHYIWGSNPDFNAAAQAFMQADRLLYDGLHLPVITQWFLYHGFIDSTDIVPIINHVPLADTEDVYGTFRFLAEILAGSAALDTSQLWLISSRSEVFSDSLHLNASGQPNEYETFISGNGETGIIKYYLSVIDSAGYRVTHPAGAPNNYHTFYVGPDTIPPTIIHEPLKDQPYLRWPAEIVAQIFDNLGLNDVRVEYYVNDSTLVDYFKLNAVGIENWYSGIFAFDTSNVHIGDSVFYRIIATDSAMNNNIAIHPLHGYHGFAIIVGGGQIIFDFETSDAGFVKQGDWEWGIPYSGPPNARSGQRVWATRLDRDYSTGPQQSTLITPVINLQGFSNATLQFWNWYDIEFGYDGANVKLSADSGQTWNIVAPIYGYDTQIDTSLNNPLAGEWSFSGKSSGWIIASFDLDVYTGRSILIKFDFGADPSIEKSGWYIDDVMITDEKAFLKPPVNLVIIDNRGAVKLAWDYLSKNNKNEKITLKTTSSSEEINWEKKNKIQKKKHNVKRMNPLNNLYFKIYKSSNGGLFTPVDSSLVQSYIDSAVISGNIYRYFITVVVNKMESVPSDTVATLVEPVVAIEKLADIPTHFALQQNFPNPFNPITILSYQLAASSGVELSIYNILGQKIVSLVSEKQVAGTYAVEWDASGLASGIYYYRLDAGDFQDMKKMVLLK